MGTGRCLFVYNMQVNIPSPCVTLCSEIPSVERSEGDGAGEKGEGGDHDEEDYLEEDEVDLRSMRPAVGPVLLQLLSLPTQPKTINNWILKPSER